MKGNDYAIQVGGILIGYAREVSDDMPNTGGRFEATDAFAEVKALFDEEYSQIRGGGEAWHRARERIFSKGLRIELLSTGKATLARPGAVPSSEHQGILAYLHIHNGKVWWRQM